MARYLERWNVLSRFAKGGIIAAAVVLQIGLIAGGLYRNQTGLVDLYPTKLQPSEVPEISAALLEMGIEHEVAPTSDGVMLAKPDRARARAVLASRNLPLHSLMTVEKAGSDPSRTAVERARLEQRVLEGEITMALRDIQGVQDARVKLAIPPKGYLADEKDVTRASVSLTLRNGFEPDRQSIAGMTNMVAYSVPGLLPENVSLLDNRGLELSKTLQRGSEGDATSAHFEVRSTEEARNQKKLQEALNQVMPDRTRVVVNMDLDFSEREHRLYTPGSEQDDGMVAASLQTIQEALNTTGKDQKDWTSKKQSINNKFRENYVAYLEKAARVQRISAVVFADGASPGEALALKETTKAALGMEEGRGDSVYVNTTPWDHSLMNQPEPESSLLAVDEADRSMTARTWSALLAAQALLMAGGVGAFAYLGNRRAATGIEDANLMSLRTTGIVDHNFSKTAITNNEMRTGPQTTEMLENLVRDRSTQVADMLRSTWLS